jgi:hypothetical protein
MTLKSLKPFTEEVIVALKGYSAVDKRLIQHAFAGMIVDR